METKQNTIDGFSLSLTFHWKSDSEARQLHTCAIFPESGNCIFDACRENFAPFKYGSWSHAQDHIRSAIINEIAGRGNVTLLSGQALDGFDSMWIKLDFELIANDSGVADYIRVVISDQNEMIVAVESPRISEEDAAGLSGGNAWRENKYMDTTLDSVSELIVEHLKIGECPFDVVKTDDGWAIAYTD